jgi:hypothetical protein
MQGILHEARSLGWPEGHGVVVRTRYCVSGSTPMRCSHKQVLCPACMKTKGALLAALQKWPGVVVHVGIRDVAAKFL